MYQIQLHPCIQVTSSLLSFPICNNWANAILAEVFYELTHTKHVAQSLARSECSVKSSSWYCDQGKCLAWLEGQGVQATKRKNQIYLLPSNFTPTIWAEYSTYDLRIPWPGYLKSILCCHMPPTPTVEFQRKHPRRLSTMTHNGKHLSPLSNNNTTPIFLLVYPPIYLFWRSVWPLWCWLASWNTTEREINHENPALHEALSNEQLHARKMPSQALVDFTCSPSAWPGLTAGRN